MTIQLNKITLWFLPVLFIAIIGISGCAHQVKEQKYQETFHEEVKGFGHKVHIQGGSTCKSCHVKATNSSEAGMPDEKLCLFCHQTVYDDQPVGELYNREEWQQSYDIVRAKYTDIKMSHQQHMSLGVKCEDCHGNIANSTKVTLEHIPVKKTCFSCHGEWNTPEKCGICHKEIITFSHPKLWGAPEHNHCLECHIPVSISPKCKDCHDTASCVTSVAPSRPGDLPHRRGLMCRACHSSEEQNLTHVDNGIDCRICHKL